MNWDTSWLPELLWFISVIEKISKIICDVNFCTKMCFKPGLQVILNDVRYHKYHHRHHHWQIPYQNVAVATRRRQSVLSNAILKCEWRQIIHGTRSFFTLQVQVFTGVLLVFSIDRRFSHCRQQGSPTTILASPEKHWLWIVFVSQIAAHF